MQVLCKHHLNVVGHFCDYRAFSTCVTTHHPKQKQAPSTCYPCQTSRSLLEDSCAASKEVVAGTSRCNALVR